MADDIIQRARAIDWYHTLELTPGFATDGVFDLRPFVDQYHVPERLDGLRVLDVGTWDGFWAFEFERRGAAEVRALDVKDFSTLDYPPRRRPKEFPPVHGEGFALARQAFGSKVERVACNLYDARPEQLGQFDVVFAGSILIHIRDQLLALERIANLVKPGGLYICAEEYDLAASLMPRRFEFARYRANREAAVVFWLPSIRTWQSMLWTAGFDTIEKKNRFMLDSRQGYSVRHVVFHARKSA